MSYSDNFKANAIALYEVEAGKKGISKEEASRRVMRALKTKYDSVPTSRTIVRWSENGHGVSSDVQKSVIEKKRDLQEVLEEMVMHAVGAQLKLIERLEEMKDLTPHQMIELVRVLSLLTGIAVDKIQLLRGEPTSIDDHRGAINIFTTTNCDKKVER